MFALSSLLVSPVEGTAIHINVNKPVQNRPVPRLKLLILKSVPRIALKCDDSVSAWKAEMEEGCPLVPQAVNPYNGLLILQKDFD